MRATQLANICTPAPPLAQHPLSLRRGPTSPTSPPNFHTTLFKHQSLAQWQPQYRATVNLLTPASATPHLPRRPHTCLLVLFTQLPPPFPHLSSTRRHSPPDPLKSAFTPACYSPLTSTCPHTFLLTLPPHPHADAGVTGTTTSSLGYLMNHHIHHHTTPDTTTTLTQQAYVNHTIIFLPLDSPLPPQNSITITTSVRKTISKPNILYINNKKYTMT